MMPFHINKTLEANYDLILNKAIPNKWDSIAMIFGREGTGKTTFSSQGAYYLTQQKVTLDNMTFTPEQFKQEIDNAEPESSIIWDEAITGATAQMHASKISQSVISKLTQIRKKKLKIFINFPYLWMLHRYFVSRCLFGVYVYAKDFDDRGYFRFYNSNKLETLYNLMKSVYQYNPKAAIFKVKPDFERTFNDFFPFDEEEYDRRKEAARIESEREGGDKWKMTSLKLLQMLQASGKTGVMDSAAKTLGVTKRYLYQVLKDSKED